jgi:hypothetical protein
MLKPRLRFLHQHREWLGRLDLFRLLEFLGRFPRRHGFSPFFALPPGAVASLYPNPGPNVQRNEVATHLLGDAEDAIAGHLRRIWLSQH